MTKGRDCMKKAIALVIALFCVVGLLGCDPGTNSIDADEILANTVKIELVHYNNPNPKLIRLGGRNSPIFDFSKVTLIATLDDSCIEDVVRDIAQKTFLVFGRTENEPIGTTLILYQSDGNMLVLYGCAYSNERGVTKYYGGCNVFDENGVFVEHLGDIGSEYIDGLERKYFNSNP